MSILANQAIFEYVIPIKVSSLKAIYFTFAQDWTPTESCDQVDYMCALASKASATGARVMKHPGSVTTWLITNSSWMGNLLCLTCEYKNGVL